MQKEFSGYCSFINSTSFLKERKKPTIFERAIKKKKKKKSDVSVHVLHVCDGVPFRKPLCFVPSFPRIPSRSTATLTRVKWLLMLNERCAISRSKTCVIRVIVSKRRGGLFLIFLSKSVHCDLVFFRMLIM